MTKRKSTVLFLCHGVMVFVVVLLCFHAIYSVRENREQVRERTWIVKTLGLTDLCLFTDARYTRNPSMADLATPFQDHPTSLEHFPSGSIIGPPEKGIYALD